MAKRLISRSATDSARAPSRCFGTVVGSAAAAVDPGGPHGRVLVGPVDAPGRGLPHAGVRPARQRPVVFDATGHRQPGSSAEPRWAARWRRNGRCFPGRRSQLRPTCTDDQTMTLQRPLCQHLCRCPCCGRCRRRPRAELVGQGRGGLGLPSRNRSSSVR
jgi:hypothetical protein